MPVGHFIVLTTLDCARHQKPILNGTPLPLRLPQIWKPKETGVENLKWSPADHRCNRKKPLRKKAKRYFPLSKTAVGRTPLRQKSRRSGENLRGTLAPVRWMESRLVHRSWDVVRTTVARGRRRQLCGRSLAAGMTVDLRMPRKQDKLPALVALHRHYWPAQPLSTSTLPEPRMQLPAILGLCQSLTAVMGGQEMSTKKRILSSTERLTGARWGEI
jgi:hypothetical protein